MDFIIFELCNGRQLVINKKDSRTAAVLVYDENEELEDEVTLDADVMMKCLFGGM